MRRLPWIITTLLALAALTWGISQARHAAPSPLTRDAATERLMELGDLLSAAIENERDASPLLEHVLKIVKQHPTLHIAHQLEGQIHLQINHIDDAYAAFDRALTIQPINAELHNLAGTAAMMRDDFAAGETHFRQAVAQTPSKSYFHLLLGDVLLKTNQLDEAEKQFNQTLSLKLMEHQANASLGDVFASRAQAASDPSEQAQWFQQAINQVETALAKLPSDDKPETLFARTAYARKLARHYHHRGNPTEALALLHALPEDDRFNPDVLAEMATYLNALGQPIVAAVQYEAAAQRSPDNPDLLVQAARWYQQAGDTQAAQLMTEHLVKKWPNHPDAKK
ncbi:MAG: tetratricopeptide repeat protein [Algisphaera sp.]